MHALYVEKRPEFRSANETLRQELCESLSLSQLEEIRVIQRYLIEGLPDELLPKVSELILSDPFIETSSTSLPKSDFSFAIEYLPGQFDQRADSAAQCIAILTEEEAPIVTSAQIYLLRGTLSKEDVEAIKGYLINPVDSHEASLSLPESLSDELPAPPNVDVLSGFREENEEELTKRYESLGLAMSVADLAHIQTYFASEAGRDPFITEIRLLDTYWSDHCRHTTFLSRLEEVTFDDGSSVIAETYNDYRKLREQLYGADTERPETLMDLAIIVAKELKKSGELDNLEVSEEINAASIIVPVAITKDGTTTEEEYLIQFKNETHNHPTEIEPFGGAATCLGGCIRDPLSGRSYVYQAMRVTGAWDPRAAFQDTLPNKLPQVKICREAADGYSSYGNQIGLATGQVSELYHPGYLAKRMEIGAVVAACPRSQVQRGTPENGDIILLLGGRTGRDGVGGATGSSKEHNETALENSAEVQKGNPPTERKIQRLFRDPTLSYKIKRCNDFGAGGVSVAIGELADSLDIDLDAVPKKYQGLDGTELAISESQERMAVVVDPSDVDFFIAACETENLECVPVAKVTDSGRLRMTWRGDTIVDLTREFIDTNGVQQSARAHITAPNAASNKVESALTAETYSKHLSDLNLASQKGLGEMFDSSIGAGTVLSPFGGKTQITPPDAMVAKVPILEGETSTCTHMSWGFDPIRSSASPFHGSVHAVADSVCKAVATGARLSDIRLTFQEYFPKLGQDPARWGLPLAALLGAFHAQRGLRLAAIGGKDSMSGSYQDLDVPPTLVSFAVAPGNIQTVASPEFKAAGNSLAIIEAEKDNEGLPDYENLRKTCDLIHSGIANGEILSVKYLGQAGLAYALAVCAFGNTIGAEVTSGNSPLSPAPLSFLVEFAQSAKPSNDFQIIGTTSATGTLSIDGNSFPLAALQDAYLGTLKKVYPLVTPGETSTTKNDLNAVTNTSKLPAFPTPLKGIKPQVLIPVFPGTNCEYDSAAAFNRAGGTSKTLVIRNLTPEAVSESIQSFAQELKDSHILMLPGGFSAGDEPDGSAKFIATFLRNPVIAEQVDALFREREGLILGICNGFQALVKSGLLPGLEELPHPQATLTHNPISRHISTYVTTRIANTNNPWLASCKVGDLHQIPVSHGEGRFLATNEALTQLIAKGQIATQYCDHEGQATLTEPFNPNQSAYAIEGITSPCGRIFGKMGHSERYQTGVAQNIPGTKSSPLFEDGIRYFS